MATLDVDQPFLNSDVPAKAFTKNTCGMDPLAFTTADEEGLTIRQILRPILLYTVAPVPGQPRGQQPPVMHPDEKFDRGAIALKIRDGGKVTLTNEDIDLLIKAIAVLPTEPYAMLRTLLQGIKDPPSTGR